MTTLAGHAISHPCITIGGAEYSIRPKPVSIWPQGGYCLTGLGFAVSDWALAPFSTVLFRHPFPHIVVPDIWNSWFPHEATKIRSILYIRVAVRHVGKILEGSG